MIKKLNYISLFSSAGIGCYGFKQNNFECIATCELLEKRLVIVPPCQWMNVAIQKKKIEIDKNSLVIKSIEIAKNILLKIFIFKNVLTFLKTICIGLDKKNKEISKEIDLVLSPIHKIILKVINFKNCDSNSNWIRTLVIAIRKDCFDYILPLGA